MLKRTSVLLVAIAMLVALMPAAAVAAPTTVELVFTGNSGENYTCTLWTVGLDEVDDDSATTDSAAGGSDGACTFTSLTADWDDDGDTEALASGDDAIITLTQTSDTWYGDVTYWFFVTLVDADNDGVVGDGGTLSVAAPGDNDPWLEGTVYLDDDGPLESADDKVSTDDDPIDAAMTVYLPNGTPWAQTGTIGGDFAFQTPRNVATVVKSDITSNTTVDKTGWDAPLNLDADDLDDGKDNGTPGPGATDADEGEVQYFGGSANLAGATVIPGATIDRTGVDILYDNDSDLNANVFDHIDFNDGPYNDVFAYWAQHEIVQLYGWGWMTGCDSNSFCPESDITRAEVAVILARIEGGLGPIVTTAVYPDVPATHWAASAIKMLTSEGVLDGFADGKFHPSAPVTRAEFSRMLMAFTLMLDGEWDGKCDTDSKWSFDKCVEEYYDLDPTLGFVDVPITYWAFTPIFGLYEWDVIDGYKNGTFHPESHITRAEAAVMLHRWDESWDD